MGRAANAAAAAAAASAAADAAEAAAKAAAASLPPNVRNGARVTIAFFLLYYLFIFAQATMKRKLRTHYSEQGKKFDRYLTRDRKMLGWDRTVGNMLEQSVSFLSLFWLNIWLSTFGGLSYVYISIAGWLYVGLRSLYPILWFAGGGGPGGTSPLIWRVTFPMYLVIITLAVNAAVVTIGASY